MLSKKKKKQRQQKKKIEKLKCRLEKNSQSNLLIPILCAYYQPGGIYAESEIFGAEEHPRLIKGATKRPHYPWPARNAEIIFHFSNINPFSQCWTHHAKTRMQIN